MQQIHPPHEALEYQQLDLDHLPTLATNQRLVTRINVNNHWTYYATDPNKASDRQQDDLKTAFTMNRLHQEANLIAFLDSAECAIQTIAPMLAIEQPHQKETLRLYSGDANNIPENFAGSRIVVEVAGEHGTRTYYASDPNLSKARQLDSVLYFLDALETAKASQLGASHAAHEQQKARIGFLKS